MGNKVQFTPPPKALRPPSQADLAAVANGDSLQLLETWQGSFLGSKLVKAGLAAVKHSLHSCLANRLILHCLSLLKQSGLWTSTITVA